MTISRIIEFIGNHPLLFGTFFAVVTFLIVTEIRRKSGSKSLTPSQVINLVNNADGIVIDIREPADYKSGHIVNARNIPQSRLDIDADKISKDKNVPIIVYCKSGAMSPAASGKLTAAGYTQVYHLKSGLYSWMEEKLPIAK